MIDALRAQRAPRARSGGLRRHRNPRRARLSDRHLLLGETNRAQRSPGAAASRMRVALRRRSGARDSRSVGPDLPIFFRFSQWKQQDFRARLAQTPQELERVLGPIADAGVDVFDGSVRYFDRAEFEGSPLNLSGWAKKLTGKLAMAIGGIGLDRGMYDSSRDGRAAAPTTPNC